MRLRPWMIDLALLVLLVLLLLTNVKGGSSYCSLIRVTDLHFMEFGPRKGKLLHDPFIVIFHMPIIVCISMKHVYLLTYSVIRLL